MAAHHGNAPCSQPWKGRDLTSNLMGHCLIIYSRKNGPPKLIRTTLCGFADRRLGYSAIGGFVRNVRFGGVERARTSVPLFRTNRLLSKEVHLPILPPLQKSNEPAAYVQSCNSGYPTAWTLLQLCWMSCSRLASECFSIHEPSQTKFNRCGTALLLFLLSMFVLARWCSQWESNSYSKLRRLAFCPLNYENWPRWLDSNQHIAV